MTQETTTSTIDNVDEVSLDALEEAAVTTSWTPMTADSDGYYKWFNGDKVVKTVSSAEPVYLQTSSNSNEVLINSSNYLNDLKFFGNYGNETVQAIYNYTDDPRNNAGYVYANFEANTTASNDNGKWSFEQVAAAGELKSYIVTGKKSESGQTLFLPLQSTATTKTDTAVITGLKAMNDTRTLVPSDVLDGLDAEKFTNGDLTYGNCASYSVEGTQLNIQGALVTSDTKIASANGDVLTESVFNKIFYAKAADEDKIINDSTAAKYFFNSNGEIAATMAKVDAEEAVTIENRIGYYESFKEHSAGTDETPLFDLTTNGNNDIEQIQGLFVSADSSAHKIVLDDEYYEEGTLRVLRNNSANDFVFNSYDVRNYVIVKTSELNLVAHCQMDINQIGTDDNGNYTPVLNLFADDSNSNGDDKCYVWIYDDDYRKALLFNGGALYGVTDVSDDAEISVSENGTLTVKGVTLPKTNDGGIDFDYEVDLLGDSGIAFVPSATSTVNKVVFADESSQVYRYYSADEYEPAVHSGYLIAPWTIYEGSEGKIWQYTRPGDTNEGANANISFLVDFTAAKKYEDFASTVTVPDTGSTVTLNDAFFGIGVTKLTVVNAGTDDAGATDVEKKKLYFQNIQNSEYKFFARLYNGDMVTNSSGAYLFNEDGTSNDNAFVYDAITDSSTPVFYTNGFYVSNLTPYLGRITNEDAGTEIFSYEDKATGNGINQIYLDPEYFNLSAINENLASMKTAPTAVQLQARVGSLSWQKAKATTILKKLAQAIGRSPIPILPLGTMRVARPSDSVSAASAESPHSTPIKRSINIGSLVSSASSKATSYSARVFARTARTPNASASFT